MTREEFLTKSLEQLMLMTGIDRSRWSRYLTGKVAINERTLNRAAQALHMEASELLQAIQLRRELSKKTG